MQRFLNIVVAGIRTVVEGIALAIFAAIVLFVLLGTFLWFLTPWQQRKAREKYHRAESDAKADALRRRVAEELEKIRQRREAEEAYRKTAAQAAAARERAT